MAEYTGKISKILFYKEDIYYVVAKFICENSNETFTIRGNIENPSQTYIYTIIGEFKKIDKQGEQFAINNYYIVDKSIKLSMIKFLSGPGFVSIGTKFATMIVEMYEKSTFEVLLEQPTSILSLENISTAQKQKIYKSVIKNKNELLLAQIFMQYDISFNYIRDICEIYGDDSYHIITTNPYEMILDVRSISFLQADEITRKLGISCNYSRVFAAIQFILKNHIKQTGSTFMQIEKIENTLLQMDIYYSGDVDEYLEQLVIDHKIIIKNDTVYEHELYYSEHSISKNIHALLNKKFENHAIDFEASLSLLEEQTGIKYGKQQIEAIQLFLNSNCMILSGGPGTGKTTVVKAMVDLYKMLYPQKIVGLVAPTGRAAKRLSLLTEQKASTIHSFLRWDPSKNDFMFNQNNPISYDVLIIDESSMMDTMILYHLLNAAQNVEKILFIGDYNQLPSIKAGNVLYDLIHTNIDKVILKDVYRQTKMSGIISFSNDILEEDVDVSRFDEFEDIFFYQSVGEDLVKNIIKIVKGALGRGYTMFDIQILAPLYQGRIGIDKLNSILQNILNVNDGTKKEYRYMNKLYREGDKVILLKNMRTDDVYNGDVGVLKHIHFRDDKMFLHDLFVIDFDGRLVYFEKEYFSYLNLAYCMSIHKSQGSEFKIVITVVLEEHAFMLNKNLFYTAVTRARDMLFLLGQESAIITASTTIGSQLRETGLIDRFFEESMLK